MISGVHGYQAEREMRGYRWLWGAQPAAPAAPVVTTHRLAISGEPRAETPRPFLFPGFVQSIRRDALAQVIIVTRQVPTAAPPPMLYAGATTQPAPQPPVCPPVYTFAQLPPASSMPWCLVCCTNARKPGESPGAGTGMLAFSDGINWIAAAGTVLID